MSQITTKVISPNELPDCLADLSEILHLSVHDGAAISFITPFTIEGATTFWETEIFPKVADNSCLLINTTLDGKVVGTVVLHIALPPNQPHRCEVAKLIVHPDYRKRGIARSLMQVLEEAARSKNKSLITLDTRTGDNAERLYTSLGFETAGAIPNFARNPTDNNLHATTYMYKLI